MALRPYRRSPRPYCRTPRAYYRTPRPYLIYALVWAISSMQSCKKTKFFQSI